MDRYGLLRKSIPSLSKLYNLTNKDIKPCYTKDGAWNRQTNTKLPHKQGAMVLYLMYARNIFVTSPVRSSSDKDSTPIRSRGKAVAFHGHGR